MLAPEFPSHLGKTIPVNEPALALLKAPPRSPAQLGQGAGQRGAGGGLDPWEWQPHIGSWAGPLPRALTPFLLEEAGPGCV